MARLQLLSPHVQGREAEVYRARGTAVDGMTYEYAARKLPRAGARPEVFRAIVAAQRVKLTHENLVKSFGIAMPEGDDDSGDIYVLSELLTCRDLRTVLEHSRRKGQSLPFPVAIHIASCLCAALEHVGARTRLVHGAITPACILLCASGDVKLGELGVTRHVLASVLTRKGPWYGPLGYASPEQLGAEDVDERSDVYQVGLVLYELLAGAPLFAGPSEEAVIEAMLRHDVPALPRARVPAVLDELVHVVLSRNPQLRPAQLGVELASIIKSTGAPEVSATVIAALVAETPGDIVTGTAPAIALRAPDLRPSGLPVEADELHLDTGEMAVPRLDTVLDLRATRGAEGQKITNTPADPGDVEPEYHDSGPTIRSVQVPEDLRHNDITSMAPEGDPISSTDYGKKK